MARRMTVDWNAAYALSAGIAVIPRDQSTVQLGLEPPRRVMIRDAPPRATEVFAALDGATPLGALVGRVGGDPLVWQSLLSTLIDAEFIAAVESRAPIPRHLLSVRAELAHRHGSVTADRLLQARQDALVVVIGPAVVSSGIAALLGASGVGHLHLRTEDGGRWHAPRPWTRPRNSQDELVRIGDPAPQVPPSMVVLAGPDLPDSTLTAELLLARIPHLIVQVGLGRVVVGPLVLPGRSACLACLERTREAADPGRQPAIPAGSGAAEPPPFLVAVGAELAADQALHHVDGLVRPGAVNATLERYAGELAVRRRSWQQHPDCGCHQTAGEPPGDLTGELPGGRDAGGGNQADDGDRAGPESGSDQ